MSQPDIDIILVSYNTAQLTLRAIQSIYDETTINANIIVVDNDSQDNSEALIREQFPAVHLIQSGANLGFAGGVNLGAKHASADHILLLNPDTVILEGAIDKLYSFAQNHPKNGIWGGITLNNDLSLNTHNAWAKLDIPTLIYSATGLSKAFKKSCVFNKANYGCWNRKTIKEVDIVCGCFFLTTKTLWDDLSGLDEVFFMYGEEADYCLRAIKKNYQPLVTPDAKIIHHGGASEVNLSGKMIKLLKGKAELINRHASKLSYPIQKGLLFLYVFNKFASYRLISLLKPSKTALFKEWKTVFKASSDWLKGYQ